MEFAKAVGVLLISGGSSFQDYFILHFDIQLLSNPDVTLTAYAGPEADTTSKD